MKLTLLQENLHKSLQSASRVVSTRASLPVLANVLFRTDEGRLQVSATNLEIGVTSFVGAKVAQNGEITVPARLLADFVAALPAGKVELDLAGDTLHIIGGTSDAHIKGIASTEFPLIPRIEGGAEITLEKSELSDGISQVAFAASAEDSRPILTGVLLRGSGNTLKMVATDSYRLAEKTIVLKEKLAQDVSVIVPARAVVELGRLLADADETVSMVLGENQILFKAGSTELTSRLIEGQFPNYEQIIPEQFETKSTLQSGALLGAVRVAALFSKETANNIRIEIRPAEGEKKPGQLVVQSATTQLGETTSSIDASVDGKESEISFNARYLQDVLGIIGPELQFEMSGKLNAGVFRSLSDPHYLHLIMPLRS